MTHSHLTLVALALAGALSASCTTPPAPGTAAGTAAPGAAAPGTPPPGTAGTPGVVAETMNAGGYTYVRLTTADKDVWLALNEMAVTVGDRLTVGLDMPMENFHAKSLNRDFPLIYFVTDVAREGETLPARSAPPIPALAGSHDPPAAVVDPIAPPPGGLSIADIYAKREPLAGTKVTVRGKVVKVNNAIMDRNWFHIQDGSGQTSDGTNDLTVTTMATVALGDIVTVTGTLASSKDFGAGYAYDAIVENATITVK